MCVYIYIYISFFFFALFCSRVTSGLQGDVIISYECLDASFTGFKSSREQAWLA